MPCRPIWFILGAGSLQPGDGLLFTRLYEMLARLRQSMNGDSDAGSNRDEWLARRWDSSVWRLTLRGVADHLYPDYADALWDYSTGGKPDIVEAVSGNRHRRLCRALQDHCRRRERRDPLHGKWILEQQCFSDLILCLPPHVWELDQRESDGLRLWLVADHLEGHHREGFRKRLPVGRSPRCLVRPQPGLAADQVEFLFGKGVYLPEPDESPAYHLLPSLDDEPVQLPPLGLWYDKVYTERPAGFYMNQGFLLLTPEGQGPLPVPGWRGPDDAYLLIRHRSENDWKASGPDSVSVRYWPAPAGAWGFECKPAAGQGTQVLTLKLLPNVTAGAVDAGKTRMPGAAPAASPYTLEMEAVALPGLSLEDQPDLLRWTLWLDADGMLATPEQVARDSTDLIALSLDQRGLRLACPPATPQVVGARVLDQFQIGGTDAWLFPCAVPGLRGLLGLASPTR